MCEESPPKQQEFKAAQKRVLHALNYVMVQISAVFLTGVLSLALLAQKNSSHSALSQAH